MSAGCWGKGGQGHGLLVQLVVVLGDVTAEAAPRGCVHGAAVSVCMCLCLCLCLCLCVFARGVVCVCVLWAVFRPVCPWRETHALTRVAVVCTCVAVVYVYLGADVV